MFERILRLSLICIIFATFFLPNTGEPNWLFISLVFLLYLTGVTSISSIGGIIFWLCFMLFLLALPILIVLNLFLVAVGDPPVKLKILYRSLLLILCPVSWGGTLLRWSGGSEGLGLWAIPIVVTVAAVMEIAFIVWRYLFIKSGQEQVGG